ncbi:MAG: ABC transporter permease [Acidobacteria bacterium]|nr:ABC transporter permease [Acidobacteriota bacterium]
MTIGDLLLDALRALWAHKTRTLLTMFGIAWGIVSITLMVAAGEGLRAGQQKQADSLGKDLMIVFSGRTSLQAGGLRAGRAIRWADTDHVAVKAEATSCGYVLPELGNTLPVRSLYNSGNLLITGSLPGFEDLRTIPIGEGRFYNEADQDEGRRVAFIGSDVKKQLFAERDPLGAVINIASIPYRVIGVMQAKEQDSSYDGRDISKVFIPFSAMVRDFPNKPPALPHTIDRMLVSPKSYAEHDTCKAQLKRTLARLHDFDPNDREAAHIWDTMQDAKAFRQMTDGMKYFLGAVGVVTLLLGGIGVMNVMLVAVRERTPEIGVRKAVGATSKAILGQFFAEAMAVVLISGACGLGFAYGVCALVNMAPMPPFFAGLLPTWQSSLLSFVLLGTVALFAALYPANRAASIDPIDALRHEAGN